MTGAADDGVGGGRHTGAGRDWVTAASFIFGGITAIGFLVIVIGEYLAANAATVLAGTTVICLGGIAWGLAALILICQLVRQRTNSDAAIHKIRQAKQATTTATGISITKMGTASNT